MNTLPKLVLFSTLLALAPLRSFASETDQYYAWGRELADSLEVVNDKFNADISQVLDKVNRRHSGNKLACDAVVDKIVNHFFFFIGKNWPELWADYSPLVARIPSDAADARHYSSVALYGPYTPLDPGVIAGAAATLRINGVNLGTDKLGHTFVEGGKYYRAYRAAIEAGATEDAAEKAAVDLGVSLEKGKLGLATSGVFSYGDLEANFQGFKFYQSLCDGKGLEKTEKGWVLRGRYDARRYVNMAWDESLNISAYTAFRWGKVQKRLVRYCDELATPAITSLKEQFRDRPASERSFSENYLLELRAAGQVPDPNLQSLELLCRNRAAVRNPAQPAALSSAD